MDWLVCDQTLVREITPCLLRLGPGLDGAQDGKTRVLQRSGPSRAGRSLKHGCSSGTIRVRFLFPQGFPWAEMP